MTQADVSDPAGLAQIVVVMGVSGVGKTTIAQGLAAALGWDAMEGDELHPAANVAKMASGQPLTDADRWPWLQAIGDWMTGELAAGRSAVVTCSALKRSYRDLLRAGRPGVRFCQLDAPEVLIAGRLADRSGHFMPSTLLPSQLATLEPLQPDEPGVRVSVASPAAQVVVDALAALGLLNGRSSPS